MQRAQQFFKTLLIGGFVVIMPSVVLVKIFLWLLGWLTQAIAPVTGLIASATQHNQLIAQALAVMSIVLGCFFIGLIVQTRAGKWFQQRVENTFLSRLPGYTILRDLFSQLQPDQKRSFSRPVLFSWDRQENYLLAYITDEYDDDRFAIFLPTSPSPLNGYVVQTTREHLKFLDTSAEQVMQVVIGCGVGSKLAVKNAL